MPRGEARGEGTEDEPKELSLEKWFGIRTQALAGSA